MTIAQIVALTRNSIIIAPFLKTKKLLSVTWSYRNHFSMRKLYKNDFSRVVTGPPGSAVTFIESVKLRHIYYIFDKFLESLSIREISEKLTIFSIMSFTNVRFFTLYCALLELLQELKHFSMKAHIFKVPEIGGYHKN